MTTRRLRRIRLRNRLPQTALIGSLLLIGFLASAYAVWKTP